MRQDGAVAKQPYMDASNFSNFTASTFLFLFLPVVLAAYFFRDSFFTAVLPWLAESFGRGAYFWEYGFDQKVIEAEHPAIVIQEIAERKLELPASELEKDRLNVRLVNGKWELIPAR